MTDQESLDDPTIKGVDMTGYTPPGEERFIPDLASRMDPDRPETLVFSMSTYQVFDDDLPTSVLAWAPESSELGILMWNLQPGQENDYHMHPATEHLHVVVEGEVEYTLADRQPVTVRAGEAVMVPAKVPHGIRNVSDKPASYVAIGGTRQGYEKVLLERP